MSAFAISSCQPFLSKTMGEKLFRKYYYPISPNSTLSRRFLGRLEELHPIDQIMVAAHFLLLAIPAFAFGPGKSSGPLPLEKHVIRRSVSDGKVADLYEGLTKEKNGKANLQVCRIAQNPHFPASSHTSLSPTLPKKECSQPSPHSSALPIYKPSRGQFSNTLTKDLYPVRGSVSGLFL
eukprot:1342579-Amorphochlora_amoeboformis.AAC.1